MNKDYDYKRLTPFKWFVLQNFPFIDEDFDAITNYQLFCKLGEEINKVINSTNAMGTQVEELTDYVANYFDNLDVQEEINNKLDEMAEDGTLEELITEYINLKGVLAFNTVADMKDAINLVDGSFVRTYGNLSLNDTCGSYYKIREITNQDTIDEFNLIALNNSETLIAERILSNIIELNIDDYEQFVDDGDWLPAFNKAFSDIYNSSPNHDLFGIVNLGHKVYTIKDTLTLPNRMFIDGHSVGNLDFTNHTKDFINFVTKSSTFIGNGGGILNVTINGGTPNPVTTTNNTISALTLGSTATYGSTSGNLNGCIFRNINLINLPGNAITINNYVGVLRMSNINIANVGGIGLLLNRCTDSIFDTFKIDGTRLAGMQLNSNSSQNKFANFKIYACGLDSSQADLGVLASLRMTNCHKNLFSNFECQDNGGAGAYISGSTYCGFNNFLVDRSGISVQAGNFYFANCSYNTGNLISNNYTETINTELGLYISGGNYNIFNYVTDEKQTGSDVLSNASTTTIYGKNYKHDYKVYTNLNQLSGELNITNEIPYDYLELTITESINGGKNYARKAIIYKNCSIDVENCFASSSDLIKFVRNISLNSAGNKLTLSNAIKYTWTTSGLTIAEQQATERTLILQEIKYCKD